MGSMFGGVEGGGQNHITQFQVEGGSLVQGVTKLVTKTMPIRLTINGVESSYLGIIRFLNIR